MKTLKAAVAAIGAVALVGSLLTNALASNPRPFGEAKAPANVKKYKVGGNLTVTGILHANANMSVYGGLYAHGGFQAWKGILVHNGGVTTDALTVNGPSALKGDTVVTGNLQASGAISGASLSTTGVATIGGLLTSNGLNAGSGSISTTGNINAGAGTIATSGSVTAGSIGAATLTTGTLATTGGVTIGGTGTTSTFKGTVDFSQANVTGIGNVGGTASTLTVGSASATTSPLTISENNKVATIGVNSAGDVTTSGGLSVGGADGVFASALTAPGSTPGTLTLTGNPINLSGDTTLTGTSNLSFSHSGSGTTATASHVLAAGDTDVAGTLPVTVAATNTTGTATYTFLESYGGAPSVVVTPAGDPGVGSRYWVAATGTAFTIHYVVATAPAADQTLNFYYHVVGQ